MNRSRSVLVTGAGGCIGSALAERLAKSGARNLILLDHAEHELHEIELALSAIEGCAPRVAVLGDICDAALLAEVFKEHRPDVIYHAAAFKHVPMMESKSAGGDSQQCDLVDDDAGFRRAQLRGRAARDDFNGQGGEFAQRDGSVETDRGTGPAAMERHQGRK